MLHMTTADCRNYIHIDNARATYMKLVTCVRAAFVIFSCVLLLTIVLDAGLLVGPAGFLSSVLLMPIDILLL